MRSFSRVLSLAVLLAFGFSAFGGTTYYVSKTGSNGDAKSWATAKTTIQAAIECCSTGGGDTVIVDDGDYADIGKTHSITLDSFGFSIPTVVYIDRPLTLKSRNGKGKTSISGQYGDGTSQDGNANYNFSETGKGAVRCIYAETSVTICGFTIRKGSTVRAATGKNNAVDNGGGVVAKNASGVTAYLIDCDVLDCRAGCGAATSYDVRPIRCRIAGNFAKDDNQVAYRNSYAFNCLFENNGNDTAKSFIFTKVQKFKVVNCTFINNHVTWIGGTNGDSIKFTACNCAFLDVIASGEGGDARYGFYNCVQAVSGGKVATGTGCVAGVSKYQYFSPAANDWSAVADGYLIGKGSTEYLTTDLTGVPSADYLTTDFTGTNPRTTGTTVAVGCFEPTMEKTLAAAVAPNTPAAVMLGATAVSNDSTSVGRWLGVGGAGQQVRVRYVGTGDVFGYTVKNDGANAYTAIRYPDNGTDGGFWLTPTPGGVTTLTAIPAKDEKWVDADAAGEGADGSEEKPFKTIPEAMAAVADYGIIRVKPGVYATGTDTGGVHIANADASACRVSLWKPVAVRSTDGAANTVLKGGSDVVTIVRPSNYTREAHVQGFTLTGGADDPARNPAQGETGGAFYIKTSSETSRNYSEGVHITDCIISNNVSSTRVIEGGWLERCYLCDNFTTKTNMDKGTSGARGTQAYGAILSGCVVTYSPQYFLSGGYPTVCTAACQNDTLMNCTLNIPIKDASDRDYRTFNTPNGYTVAYNDATVSGYFDTKASSVVAAGIVTSPEPSTANRWMTVCPEGTFFSNAAAADYRPIAGCPGSLAGAPVAAQHVRYETGDFDGKALDCQVNGASIPGAFQSTVKMLLVACDSSRGAVTPSESRFVDDGETITFTATVGAHRFLGWVVDGVTNETASTTYTYTADYGKDAFSIEPIFAHDLYVDASKADDSGDGSTPGTAKKTLAAIGAFAVSGDTIHAAPGDYNDGSMTQTAKIAVDNKNCSPSRIVVPAGVTLEATDGPDVTFITGSATEQGTDGVRCVAAFAGATVRGFTMRDGATFATTGADHDNNLGGCALAPFATSRKATAFFENCVFSGGKARTGGCVCGGYLYRCRISNGVGNAGCSLAYHSVLDHSIACGNKNTGVRSPHGIYSSTVINLGSGNTYRDFEAADDTARFENSILVCLNQDLNIGTNPVHKNMKNCLWNVGKNATKIDDATCCNVVTCAVNTASLETALASLGLDADFRPLKGSVVIDKGDNAFLAGLVDPLHDIHGSQRIYNAEVDIGAAEYDWRVDYAAALGKRLQVTACDSAVELIEGQVHLPAGATLEVTSSAWRAGGELQLGVGSVQGSLNVYQNESSTPSLTVTAAGEYKLTVADGVGPRLRFVADADGSTDLSELRRISGMMVIVR